MSGLSGRMDEKAAKLSYATPELVEWGSVEELTLGILTAAGDGDLSGTAT